MVSGPVVAPVEKVVRAAQRRRPIGQLVDGRYRLSEAIGTCGSGTVYLAEDISLGRRVAVKVLAHRLPSRDPAFVRQFRAEAQAVCRR
jgi:serine/threonine-protein kinase